MRILTKKTVLVAAISLFCLSACKSTVPLKRPDFVGTDQVGEIDQSMLIGTWQVAVLNPRSNEPDIDAQFVFNADGTSTGYSKAQYDNEAGVVNFVTTGVWSVQGDKIIQRLTKVSETTGNPFAVFGMAFNMELFQGKQTAANLYEVSANQLVIYNETLDVAQRFTRVN